MTLPDSLFGWATSAGIIIAGGVALYGQIDKMWRERKKGDGDADDRLIKILKETVDELEAKVDNQQWQIEVLTKKIDGLRQENKTLTQVLQGRDSESIEFKKQLVMAISRANETHEMCKSTNENVDRLCTLMEQHMRIIESKS